MQITSKGQVKFYPAAESWLVNSNFRCANGMQGGCRKHDSYPLGQNCVLTPIYNTYVQDWTQLLFN